MRACLVLCVAAALVGAALADCTACIDGWCYHKHRLPVPRDSGRLMDIDRKRNILYTVVGNKLKQCQLDSNLCKTTTFSWEIELFAVDQSTGDTYARLDNSNLTNSYNLCKLDLVNNENKFLVRDGVYYLLFKDKIYYAAAYSKGIFTYEDGQSSIVAGTEELDVLSLVVDKNNDIYYKIELDDKYFIGRVSKGAVDATVKWEDFYWVRTDKDGNAVLIHHDTHAVYRVIDEKPVEVGAIDDSMYYDNWFETPLFDKYNNIIYRYNSSDYFQLKRDVGVKCKYSISQNTTIITEAIVKRK